LTDKNEKENSSPNVNADEKGKSLIVDNVFIYPENIFNRKAVGKRKRTSSSVVTSNTWRKQKKLKPFTDVTNVTNMPRDILLMILET